MKKLQENQNPETERLSNLLKKPTEHKPVVPMQIGCILLSLMIGLFVLKNYDPTNGFTLFQGYLLYTSLFLCFMGFMFYTNLKEESIPVITKKETKVVLMLPPAIKKAKVDLTAGSIHDNEFSTPHESKEDFQTETKKTKTKQLKLELTS